MTMQPTSRRNFLRTSAQAGVLTAVSASSYRKIYGANERIRVGMIGSGWRSVWHIGWIYRCQETVPAEVVAVCDIWTMRLEQGVNEVKKRFDRDPVTERDYQQLLARADIDAVVIATPDHQHATMLKHAVEAGKDVYVEKPIAMEIEELHAAREAVLASDCVVQVGTQGRSSAGAAAARAFVQSGQLGQVIRVEECRSHYIPYWNHYPKPESPEETDWQAFLFNRPDRPFDPDQHGCWMGYRDFSSGTIGGWMSHFSDFTHFVTGASLPTLATAQGGIYSPTSEPQRTCPDTVSAILHYEEGFSTLYTTHFGNAANDYTLFFGTKGTMRINAPDGNADGIGPVVSGEGSEHPEKVQETIELENTTEEDHMTNWLRCITTRETPNADIEAGYAHGVACILADRAYAEGRQMRYEASQGTIASA